MKHLILTAMLLAIACNGWADGGIIDLKPGYSVQKSHLDSHRFDIKNKSGSVVGYIKKDNLDPRRYLLWGPKGKIQGYFKTSPLDDRKMMFFKAPHMMNRRDK